jgi:hypothetical protein
MRRTIAGGARLNRKAQLRALILAGHRGRGRPKEYARDYQLIQEVRATKEATGCPSTRAALRLILTQKRKIKPARGDEANKKILRNWEAKHSKALKNIRET